MRSGKRSNQDLRPVKITPNFLRYPHGSVLMECGITRIICSAMAVEEVPGWMKHQKVSGGWVTGEYQMIPGATPGRNRRETGRGPSGRSQEIQRLIGRSLRAAVDLEKLGARTIYLDCDVIDADGGTRCAAITGAMVALRLAVNKLMEQEALAEDPICSNIAAVSVGIVDGELMLDLCYEEDSGAEVDMNVIMDDAGNLVEVQATAEGKAFPREQLDSMLTMAASGIRQLLTIQQQFSG